VAFGISRAVRELSISKVILGWNGKTSTTNYVFGSIVEKLITSTSEMILVVKNIKKLDSNGRIIVVVPKNSSGELGFDDWLRTTEMLAMRLKRPITFAGEAETLENIRNYFFNSSIPVEISYEAVRSSHPIPYLSKTVAEIDLLIIIAARRWTLSYEHYIEHMPRDLARYYENNNFIIIYPKQQAISNAVLTNTLDGRDGSTIAE
jgi:hypothetical protein